MDLREVWYRALRAEFGVEVIISSEQDRIDLYNARKAANDPRLDGLKMVQFQDGKIFIVKREAKMEDGDATSLR